MNLKNIHTRLRNFSHPYQREEELKGKKNKDNLLGQPPTKGGSYISRGGGGRAF